MNHTFFEFWYYVCAKFGGNQSVSLNVVKIQTNRLTINFIIYIDLVKKNLKEFVILTCAWKI